MKLDWFLVGVALALGLARLAPAIGTAAGPIHMGLITDVGVAIVFFLHGADLRPASLRSASTQWRLHLLIQASTYVLFPAVGLAVFFGSRGLLSPELRMGFFYLCAVSSTISTSVAMTALAKGNVPVAVFNATLSGLLGMALTPLLLGLVTAAGAATLPLGPAIASILIKLAAPFALGQLLRPFASPLLSRHKKIVSTADRAVILLIVYSAFCEAFAADVWSRGGSAEVAIALLLAGAMLGLVLTITTLVSRALGLPRQDEIALVFCGSKKSLANGAPIAKVLLGASPMLGVIMLPLLYYHQLQLIVGSILARRYAAQAEPAPASILAETQS